jgi:hypothetical protein
MEEMIEETLDTVDDEELEEEADAEVDMVLFELTDGKLGQAGKVGGELPVSHPLPEDSKRGSRMLMCGTGGEGGRGGRPGDAENAVGDARSPEFMRGWKRGDHHVGTCGVCSVGTQRRDSRCIPCTTSPHSHRYWTELRTHAC